MNPITKSYWWMLKAPPLIPRAQAFWVLKCKCWTLNGAKPIPDTTVETTEQASYFQFFDFYTRVW